MFSAPRAIAGVRQKMDKNLNHLTSKIIEAAINVHKELGPGLLESVYNSCLIIELKNMNLNVQFGSSAASYI